MGLLAVGAAGCSSDESSSAATTSSTAETAASTTAVTVEPGVIRLDFSPPASVPAGEPWILTATGTCVADQAAATGQATPATVPSSRCEKATVALIRGPGNVAGMSSGPLVDSTFTGSLPAMEAGESIQFHFEVANGDESYRVPESGEFEVVAR